jgi:hypothetical protein
VYDSTGQDIDETVKITGFKRASIVDALRYVKIRDIATHQEITKYLTTEEREQIYSHRINMTVLERWFGNSQVREAWHIEFDETGVTVKAESNSFYAAYAKFLKLMLNKNNELGYMVNTRTIDSKFQEIFDYLPKVKPEDETNSPNHPLDIAPTPLEDNPATNGNGGTKPETKFETERTLKGNPKRRQLTDRYHKITSQNYKLNALFQELQKLSVVVYPNVTATSIRIFLELSVDEYIYSNDLKTEMSKRERKKIIMRSH